MDGNSIYKELLNHSEFSPNIATSSAFVQQRNKILPFAFEFLFHEFNQAVKKLKTYKGYRLLAVDDSDLSIAHNPDDSSTYFQSRQDTRGFNLIYLNVMYDPQNKIYVDACIQFTVAIQICKRFIRCSMPPTHIEALIKKNILPIRKDRQNLRKIKFKSAKSFLYRVV